MQKQTKIGSTIGPSCDSKEIITAMIKAGMNFARLNFAHGEYETHSFVIKKIRALERKIGQPIAILQDLQGPRIRVGELPAAGIKLTAGAEIVFNSEIKKYRGEEIPVDYSDLPRYLKAGERMLLDDGHIEVQIIEVGKMRIKTKVVEGGTLLSHKGINLPDSTLSIPLLNDKDKADVRFGVENGVDMVGMSFVSSAEDIRGLRRLMKKCAEDLEIKNYEPFIIAKIERHEAVKNFSEILAEADGIMVARGDLGLELPAARVPLVQKQIIDKANALAKPVIVATQMLGSMAESRRPTRAEVSDVANAVIDHADALLLTNETASGQHPVLSVKTMADIIKVTEKSEYDDTDLPPIRKKGTSSDVAISEISRILADEVNAKYIVAASLTGETARLISHLRPSIPILVSSSAISTLRRVNISWGVKPFILPTCKTIEELIKRSIDYILKKKLAKKGDKIIVVAGEPVGKAGNVNLVEVKEI